MNRFTRWQNWLVLGLVGAWVAACSDGTTTSPQPEMETAGPEPEAAPVADKPVGPVILATVPGGTEIDLTCYPGPLECGVKYTFPDNAFVEQESDFPGSTGTGVFDSFVRYSVKGHETDEEGQEQCYNTAGRPLPWKDCNSSKSWTIDLQLSNVPTYDIGGTQYRRFRYDINETNSDLTTALLSVDVIKLYVADQPSLNGETFPSDPYFGQGAGHGRLVWDMDDAGDGNVWLDLSYRNAPGSGEGDMWLYIPESAFGAEGEDCPYDDGTGLAGECNWWVYLYSYAGANQPASDGFEEWSVQNAAWLVAEKTVVPAATCSYTWTLTKNVAPDWDLFVNTNDPDHTSAPYPSESGTSEYTLVASPDECVQDGWSMEGYITIHNYSEVDVQVTDIEDMVGTDEATVECPEGTAFAPFELRSGNDAVCYYHADLTAGGSGTNTVTVKFTDPNDGSTGSTSFSKDYDFAEVEPTPTGNLTVHIDDTNDDGDFTASSDDAASQTHKYTQEFDCSETGATLGNEYKNEAKITELPDVKDDATVTVNCYELSSSKTATGHFKRDYDWAITKEGSVTSINAPAGAPDDLYYPVDYTIGLDMTGSTDSDYWVDGIITITNPAPMDATINSLTDLAGTVNGVIDATDCTFPLTVPKNDNVECGYETGKQSSSSVFAANNKSTAVQQLYDYDKDKAATTDGTTKHVAEAPISFGDPTDLEDDCVTVTDTYAGALGTVCYVEGGGTHWDFTYIRNIYPAQYDDCMTHEIINTAEYETDGPLSIETGYATWTVILDIPCPSCTRTPGYWKTHNVTFWGGAPPDATWLLINSPLPLPGTTGYDELSPFATSGDGQLFKMTLASYPDGSYFDAMWTPPQEGNAYWSLAHHYIAAALNELAPWGELTSAAQAAFDDATAFFGTAGLGPDNWEGFGFTKAQLLGWKSVLADYNESGDFACDLDPVTAAWLNTF